MHLLRIILLGAVVAGCCAWGQYDSRAAEIEAARAQKAAGIKPEQATKTEQVLVDIKDRKLIERLTGGTAGWRVKIGGMPSQQGFALGPEYLRRDLAGGRVEFRGSARGSFLGAYIFDLELKLPRIADGLFFADLAATHRNLPRMGYYGPGPDSKRQDRTSYRLEDTAYDFTGGIRPARHLSLGLRTGYLQVNAGPGNDSRFASTERAFSPLAVPGLARQTNFLRGGAFVQFDNRDNPGGPRRGGNYLASWTYFSDRDLKLHTFRRVDLEAQHYIPFLNDRRVIALRARSALTNASGGQSVPFYLQPIIGGSETLRGFRHFRFHDDNSLVANAEYRWESFSGLDMALFADAGKVFHRIEDWNKGRLETSYGMGFRFNVRNNVFLRVDVARSREGFRVWFKFNNVF